MSASSTHRRPTSSRLVRLACTLAALGLLAAPLDAQWPSDDAEPDEFRLAMNAKILCSGVFVQHRDAGRHIRQDLKAFDHFGWSEDFSWSIDYDARRVTLSTAGVPSRVAQHNGDQGCSVLPRNFQDIRFQPREVGRDWSRAEQMPWPTGENLSDAPLPPEVDVEALEAALDRAMDNDANGQNTRGLVVVYKGRLIGERYAEGIPRDMPHLSWSQGKSITAALIGVLVEQGELTVDQPAPVAEWQGADDPRRTITILDLLRMSSGLDFNNWGIGRERSLSTENHHFRIYFDGIDVFRHAVSFPLEAEPGTRWEYLNSDPLTLGKIVRETVEARGQSYHAFPWTDLFDPIGMKNVVLETDAWGNFIMTGYDYASARDWARFGLLHLRDGVWEGERILPEGWSELVSTPAPANEDRAYGGLFWLNAGGRYDRIPADAYWPSGFMGQTTMIIPSRDMVVVRLGPSPGGFGPYLNRTVGEILDAVGGG